VLYGDAPKRQSIRVGFTHSLGRANVLTQTHTGAQVAVRRRRAAITTAAAILAAAAFAVPAAQADVHASENDPNTTLPASFTDDTGLSVGLCTDGTARCSSIPPDANAPTSTANFDPSGEAFWMLANASFTGALAGDIAEFALEAAFLGDIVPEGGSAFSRIRFRFDLDAGKYRITHPYGVNTYTVTTGGNRSVNDTADIGCMAQPCDETTASFGTVKSILTWGADAPAGYIGDPGVNHTVSGSPTGFNGVRVERQVSAPDVTNPGGVWSIVDETHQFSLEGKLAGPVPAAAPFVGLSTTSVAFAPRRSDETSLAKKVIVTNTGAAPLNISAVTVSGDPGSFPVSGSCVGRTTPVASQGTCEVIVGFTAAGAVGARAATLSIASDAANAASVPVDLSGSITSLGAVPTPVPPPAQGSGAGTIGAAVPGAGATGAVSTGAATTPAATTGTGATAAGTTGAATTGAATTGASPGSGAGVLPGSLGVAGATARSQTVSNLALSQRISITRLRAQGLRTSMRLQPGTRVVRVAVYRARNGQKTGSALLVSYRVPRSAGAYRVVLRDRALIRKLAVGQYVIEVQAGKARTSLATPIRRAFRVTR
jgi:hypothetical protein